MTVKNILNINGNKFLFSSSQLAAKAYELLANAETLDELIYAKADKKIKDFPKDLYEIQPNTGIMLSTETIKAASKEQIEIEKQSKADYKPY